MTREILSAISADPNVSPAFAAAVAPRMARCECGKTLPSDGVAPGYNCLPFFEARGPGSHWSAKGCKGCGYYAEAHTPEVRARNAFVCDSFEPGRVHEFDSFYCGCRGWD